LGGLNKQGNRVLSPLSDAKAMRILAFFLLFRFSDSTDQFYAHTKKKSIQENGWVTSYLRSSPAQIKFLHVPKTGGLSTSLFFNNCSGVHFLYGVHNISLADALKQTEFNAFITLRDPVDQLVSIYNWGERKMGRDFEGDKKSIAKKSCALGEQLCLPHGCTKGECPEEDTFRITSPRTLIESRPGKFLRLFSYSNFYFKGIALGDPRVKAICHDHLEGELRDLSRLNQAKCPGQLHDPAYPIPSFHVTATKTQKTVVDDEVRQALNEHYLKSDKAIFDFYCTHHRESNFQPSLRVL